MYIDLFLAQTFANFCARAKQVCHSEERRDEESLTEEKILRFAQDDTGEPFSCQMFHLIFLIKVKKACKFLRDVL